MKTHKINIDDNKTVFAVQDDFNKIFPYLRIEFLKTPDKKLAWLSDITLSECRSIHTNGILSIDSETTVANLAQIFQDNFGLTALIFRHSGKAWLETSKTDYWTLEQQNKLGEELCKGN